MTPKAAPKSAITARVRQNRWRSRSDPLTSSTCSVKHLLPSVDTIHFLADRAMGLFGPSTQDELAWDLLIHRPFAWRGSRTDVLRATFYGLELALAEPGIWSA